MKRLVVEAVGQVAKAAPKDVAEMPQEIEATHIAQLVAAYVEATLACQAKLDLLLRRPHKPLLRLAKGQTLVIKDVLLRARLVVDGTAVAKQVSALFVTHK